MQKWAINSYNYHKRLEPLTHSMIFNKERRIFTACICHETNYTKETLFSHVVSMMHSHFSAFSLFFLVILRRYGYIFFNFIWYKNGNAGGESNDDENLPNIVKCDCPLFSTYVCMNLKCARTLEIMMCIWTCCSARCVCLCMCCVNNNSENTTKY